MCAYHRFVQHQEQKAHSERRKNKNRPGERVHPNGGQVGILREDPMRLPASTVRKYQIVK